MTKNILARGDALEPDDMDLIVQIMLLDVGKPVPRGWRVTSGNIHHSEIVRVIPRFELELESDR